MYNSPVFFDRSEAIVEKFSIQPERRKYLIVFDQKADHELKHFLNYIEQEVDYETFEMAEERDREEIQEVLLNQKMGTQLYIATDWDNAEAVFTAAIEAGFTEEEIQVVVYGPKRRYVYCMKCYSLSEIDEAPEVQCSHCDAHMEVGPFFSKVRKGYIGYPFIPN
ncbi:MULTISPECIES: hypothetical protein [Bacillaceae]|uniref:hypothetical protein n=1 Tax=Bacillaceae TaxID=186817 RepID=UPI000E72BA51|nr:hypothetical protein [Bacillus sp. PK3_68]RJS61215.1 hypothetical protein CJ483_15100 [Bacillus sp. PK3_68]